MLSLAQVALRAYLKTFYELIVPQVCFWHFLHSSNDLYCYRLLCWWSCWYLVLETASVNDVDWKRAPQSICVCVLFGSFHYSGLQCVPTSNCTGMGRCHNGVRKSVKLVLLLIKKKMNAKQWHFILRSSTTCSKICRLGSLGDVHVMPLYSVFLSVGPGLLRELLKYPMWKEEEIGSYICLAA